MFLFFCLEIYQLNSTKYKYQYEKQQQNKVHICRLSLYYSVMIPYILNIIVFHTFTIWMDVEDVEGWFCVCDDVCNSTFLFEQRVAVVRKSSFLLTCYEEPYILNLEPSKPISEKRKTALNIFRDIAMREISSDPLEFVCVMEAKHHLTPVFLVIA